MLAGKCSADCKESTRCTLLLDVFLQLIDIRNQLHVANGEEGGIVEQGAINTALVRSLDVDKLHVALLQWRLVAEVGETLGVLHLAHTNDGTTHTRQHVGSHLGEHASHVAQFVGVFKTVPFVGTRGQKFIVVLAFIVASVEEVLLIVKAHTIDRELLVLCRCSHCGKHHGQ